VFGEMTQEEIDEIKMAELRNQELTARVRRLMAEELSYEQIETLNIVFVHIANSQNPGVMARWYEGVTHGIISVRDLVLGESEKIDGPFN